MSAFHNQKDCAASVFGPLAGAEISLKAKTRQSAECKKKALVECSSILKKKEALIPQDFFLELLAGLEPATVCCK